VYEPLGLVRNRRAQVAANLIIGLISDHPEWL
jgi:hypothetical protein